MVRQPDNSDDADEVAASFITEDEPETEYIDAPNGALEP